MSPHPVVTDPRLLCPGAIRKLMQKIKSPPLGDAERMGFQRRVKGVLKCSYNCLCQSANLADTEPGLDILKLVSVQLWSELASLHPVEKCLR